jgi:hypothetical protein
VFKQIPSRIAGGICRRRVEIFTQTAQRLATRGLQIYVTPLAAYGTLAGLSLEERTMTITLEIRPEVQAELARQAASQGRALEAVAASLLEEAVHLPSPPASRVSVKNLVELSEPIRGLLSDKEIDDVFSRNPSTGRPVDLL